jgi:hypothetical protein
MAGPFSEPPYPPLTLADFGPAMPYRVELRNGGRTVVIGDPNDLGYQRVPGMIAPGPSEIDVVIHGLPDRFIDQLGGRRAIPAAVVTALLESVGLVRGTPLRLLSCYAGEAPALGPCVAQQLATDWGGLITAPAGRLRVMPGMLEVDLVEWDQDPLLGAMPRIVGRGAGGWLTFVP